MPATLCRLALPLALLAAAAPALADEGMWTFDNFPAARVAASYGFTPSQAWLDHVRLASLRVAGGCSASIVSANGLVMTNHHCVRGCLEALSANTGKDYSRDGFTAATLAEERRCPGLELDQLVEISEVTERVQAATRGVAADRFDAALRATTAGIEKQCATSEQVRCEVVSLYRGGVYSLYRYRRLPEVRLVFAPEDAIADFGGDPDNFNFPRYALDVAFLRIVDAAGELQATPEHLAWASRPVKDGEATFVSGNPGSTLRGLTVAQLEDQRDFRLPDMMNRAAEMRGLLFEYQHRGTEQRRHSTPLLLGYENRLKALKGRHAALADPAFYGQLAARERALREQVAARPELASAYAGTWEQIAVLVRRDQALRRELEALDPPRLPRLLGVARTLVRYAEETGKPNGERLPDYADARLPRLRQTILAGEPSADELEIATLGWWLTRLREDLGPDHPVVRRVLGARSPLEVASAAVQGTRLKEAPGEHGGPPPAGSRAALLAGGKAAIDASGDPLILLVRSFEAEARAVRKAYEAEVQGPLRQQEERLAAARFAVSGRSDYPDATFTLRLSYGAVRGFAERGRAVPPFTTFGGAFERSTGAEPFALPPSWLAVRAKVPPATPFNFVTSNDVIGGNSGSPVINARGEVVGLVFDGNIHSLGGEFGYDAALNRTVSVHASAIVESLVSVYGVPRLAAELQAR